jgi:hypothetical protein
MNIESLVQGFMGSPQGQQAAAALAQRGFRGDQVQAILGHSAWAGAQHVEQHHRDGGGLLGEHAGLSFFAAFASGLIKGDGVVGSLEDGAAGVVMGRIAEALTARLGFDSAAADAAAAATAPYVMGFLKQHIGF